MLKPFVCGTFHHEDDDPCITSPGSSPRKSKRKDSRNNNPYSTRGLDKFSALLADLDEKRQKIYSQMSPHDISFVRFAYSSTDDFVPIVVKVKNKDRKHKSEELRVVKAQHLTHTSEPMDKSATESTAIVEKRKQPNLESDKRVAKKSFSWNMKKWDMWKPSFYVPVVMILILLLLTVFGRSVTTLCTCVLWYIIPTLKDSSLNPRKSMKKKDYVRGLSEKKVSTTEGTNKKKEYVRGLSEKKMEIEGLVSPRSGNPEASKNKYTGKHGHKNSWFFLLTCLRRAENSILPVTCSDLSVNYGRVRLHMAIHAMLAVHGVANCF